jgi:WD40 repeat protein
LGSLQLEKTFTGHTGHIGTIDLNANSSLMVSGSYEDKTLKIWNPTGGLIQTISNSDNISTSFFDSDDNIYFADKGGNFRIINKTGISLFQVTAGNPIHYADFNENAKLFVTYSANGAIKVFHNTPVWMEY